MQQISSKAMQATIESALSVDSIWGCILTE